MALLPYLFYRYLWVVRSQIKHFHREWYPRFCFFGEKYCLGLKVFFVLGVWSDRSRLEIDLHHIANGIRKVGQNPIAVIGLGFDYRCGPRCHFIVILVVIQKPDSG